MQESASARRRFLWESTLALLGAGVVVSSCRSEPPAGPAAPEGRAGAISLNHGHEAVVSAVQLAAGTALRLEIQGASAHGHALDLAAEDVARIRAGETVSVLSAPGWEDKHDHRVVFNA